MPKTYPKTCLICSTAFIALRGKTKYCSPSCAGKAYNRRCRVKNGVSRATARRKTLYKRGLCICLQPLKNNQKSCERCLANKRLRNKRYDATRVWTLTQEQLTRGKLRKREWYQKNKQHVMNESDKWRKKNPDKAIMKTLRRRARKLCAEGSHTQQEWLQILANHNHQCAHCGSNKNITRDHIIPLSKGGSDYASNIQPLCRSCNSRKGSKIAA